MGCVHWKKQIRNFIHTMKERWKSGIWHTIRALYGRSHWAYYLAYLKVHAYSERAKQDVKEQLEVLECALKEGCIGQLPEIYDGKNPVSSKGCFAQAWSVGELLRVYEQIEKKKK